MKSKALLLAFALLPFSVQAEPPPKEDSLGSRHTVFDSVAYDFYVTRSALAKAPKWKPSSPFPPLSPKAAEKIAFAQLKTFVPDKIDHIGTDEITLERVEREDWIYLVVFHYMPEGPVAGGVQDFTIPVYLDGSTIPPEILKLNDR